MLHSLAEFFAALEQHHLAAGRDYRTAKAAVGTHRRTQAVAEVARTSWLKAHRGVPAQKLYDRKTGVPLDPELLALSADVDAAVADTAWCRALVAACYEALKPGESLASIIERNEAHRPQMTAARGHAFAAAG